MLLRALASKAMLARAAPVNVVLKRSFGAVAPGELSFSKKKKRKTKKSLLTQLSDSLSASSVLLSS